MFKKIVFFPVLAFGSLYKLILKGRFGTGFIIGALIALLVNVATIQLQDSIERQRYYELLELEIFSQRSDADASIDYYKRTIAEKGNLSASQSQFSTEVWKSGLNLGYLVYLDPEVQVLLHTHYGYVDNVNGLIKVASDQAWQARYDSTQTIGTEKEELLRKELADTMAELASRNKAELSINVANQADKILEKFHPTENRFKNPILKLFIGDKKLYGTKVTF